jgi:hypothetical protein
MEKSVESLGVGEQAVEMAALLEQLRAEHKELESRLAEIDSHLSLTAEEQVERARIKKLKLAKKDLIYSLTRQQQHYDTH